MANRFEIPTLANTKTDHLTELLGSEVQLFGQFTTVLPVCHLLTATIAKGAMEQIGSGRFIEFKATADLSQPEIKSKVWLAKNDCNQKIWRPSCFALSGPYLARLTIDLHYDRLGEPTAELVGFPPDSDIGEEVSRFLRLASQALKR